VENASKDLMSQQQLRDELRTKLRRDRKQGQLLTKESIGELKKLDSRVKELSKRVKLSRVNLDMEKICAYLQRELESSIEQSEQKKLIAEVGLIDRQLTAILAMVPEQQQVFYQIQTKIIPSADAIDKASESGSSGSAIKDIYNSDDVSEGSASLAEESTNTVTDTDTDTDTAIDKITTDYLALIDDDELNIISMEVQYVDSS